ncbi:MAG: flagellar motor switch protein FliN [Treponema sp.]|nr:flagellar motor switch protein FliN [Treponema sp.]
MSDGAISQSEIDALLSGVDMGGISAAPASAASFDVATLGKFAGGLKDKLAGNLNTMTGASFEAGNPSVEAQSRDELLSKLPDMVIAIMADFNTGLKGDHLFVLSPEFGQKLTSLINGEENAELDDMALSVISEVVSQHTGSEITDLSAGGKLPGLASNPAEAVHVPKAMARIPQGAFCLFTYPVTLDGQTYTLWEAVSEEVAQGMVTALGGNPPPQAAAAGDAMGTLSASDLGSLMGGASPQPAGGMMQQPGAGGMNMGMQQPMMGGGMPMGMNTPNVQHLQFPNLAGGPTAQEQGNIGLIMDVNMEMTVELGRTKKQIKEILGMGEGTIIELDKLAGEPVDILVNHKAIAKGEVVVIDENFGVRVTEILAPIDRVGSIQ